MKKLRTYQLVLLLQWLYKWESTIVTDEEAEDISPGAAASLARGCSAAGSLQQRQRFIPGDNTTEKFVAKNLRIKMN